jgi:hypothetical protein
MVVVLFFQNLHSLHFLHFGSTSFTPIISILFLQSPSLPSQPSFHSLVSPPSSVPAKLTLVTLPCRSLPAAAASASMHAILPSVEPCSAPFHYTTPLPAPQLPAAAPTLAATHSERHRTAAAQSQSASTSSSVSLQPPRSLARVSSSVASGAGSTISLAGVLTT